MVVTRVASILPLYEEECYKKLYDQLPDFRKEKADQYKHVETRLQSVAAWILYELVKKEYHLQGNEVFNLSHSGEYVLCSVLVGEDQTKKVGCDIEKIAVCNLNIAKRYFCESERQMILEEKDVAKQKETFFRYWVLKESFVKATREGVSLGLSNFEIILDNGPYLNKRPERYQEEFWFKEAEAGKGNYRIAICSTDCEIDTIQEIFLG